MNDGKLEENGPIFLENNDEYALTNKRQNPLERRETNFERK